MIPIVTQNTKFVEWADALKLLRPDLEINPIVTDDKQWREWAFQLIQSQQCQTNNAPRPDSYETWQLWSDAFVKSFASNA